MKLEEIKEPIGKLIIDSGLGKMTQDGLYLRYDDVITMMRKYAESQNKDLTRALEAIKKLTSDEQSPLMKALHEIAHKTLKAVNKK